ncbi:General transcription factor II-I repeat domain containing protein 2A [Dissostichus eleginoides]|uniref:General transcription factor II-I repeat domain containing protein 2A n=1 Tax=Dissostichus eleginoides TaxID=100907 RepID=A0AAD9EUR3_DISEL|nr:General transcription factor II-I repeat domain containing protein 2A [Dissostichus eleginoides]
MDLVIQIVNKIMAKGFNHRPFYHVKTFLESKGLTYPELEHPDWLEKLHFMVDMTGHLNMLNKSLQGKGSTALQMLEDVLAFERKMTVFARDVQKGTFSHFPSLREFKEAHNHINCEYLQRAIIEMQTAFGQRFSEFRKEKNTLSFPVTPLDIDPSMLNMSPFTGLISKMSPVRRLFSLGSTNGAIWKSSPNPTNLCFETWNAIPDTYMNMKKYAFGVLSIFGSSMNYIKSKYRSRLTDDSLRSCVKIKVTSYSPDIEKLSSDVQKQKSH